MSKNPIQYVCSSCGAITPKWSGQCPDCESWNTLSETIRANRSSERPRFKGYAGETKIQRINGISIESQPRTSTQNREFDRVLGGGLVPGSVILVGGDPGIGKSTLLLQTLANLNSDWRGLYVTGEESLQQVSLRAHRLGFPDSSLQLLSETAVETILGIAQKERPKVMVIDSIQTLYTQELQSAPGSVAQVRESSAQLVRYAKQTGTALFLVGHVTKEGALAGPRVLEHMVDTVVYFEGDRSSRFRVMRAIKNRFGAVNELGVFGMTEQGLREVANPSAIFLSRHESAVPGSTVMVTWEGTRPLLVEVQALVDDSRHGSPRRVTVGMESNRLAMLLAILHRHGGIAVYDQDVFINIVGGVKITETAADLAILASVLSSFRDQPLDEKLIIFGEIGLAGEIRPVPNGEDRIKEAAKHGFTTAIVPRKNQPRRPPAGMKIYGVDRLHEALEQL